ncbi:hypothetical protein Tco_0669710 [Tanacetum coccineum]
MHKEKSSFKLVGAEEENHAGLAAPIRDDYEYRSITRYQMSLGLCLRHKGIESDKGDGAVATEVRDLSNALSENYISQKKRRDHVITMALFLARRLRRVIASSLDVETNRFGDQTLKAKSCGRLCCGPKPIATKQYVTTNIPPTDAKICRDVLHDGCLSCALLRRGVHYTHPVYEVAFASACRLARQGLVQAGTPTAAGKTTQLLKVESADASLNASRCCRARQAKDARLASQFLVEMFAAILAPRAWYDTLSKVPIGSTICSKWVPVDPLLVHVGRQIEANIDLSTCVHDIVILWQGELYQKTDHVFTVIEVIRMEHLKMEMEIPCSNKIKFITACSFSNDSFEDIMKAQVSVIKASATLNIQAFKIKKSVSISFRMTQVHKMAKDHMMMIKDYDWMMISKKLKDHIQVKLKPKSLKFTASDSQDTDQ